MPGLPKSYTAGRRLYRDFYGFDPRKEVEYNLEIPDTAYEIGRATQVLYRSDKLNPTTLVDEGTNDYYHDHSGGVRCLLFKKSQYGREVTVPKRIREARVLTVLGKCLGFTVEIDGETHEIAGTNPLPELCALPPKGRSLLVVQGKKRVLAVLFGGKLRVEPRGIVG